MAVSLAEVAAHLPNRELRRVQKQLKTILSGGPPARLRPAIQQAYLRLGRASEFIEKLQLRPLIEQMLDAFGVIDLRRASSEERSALERCPCVVWLDEGFCTLSIEAIDWMAEDPELRFDDLLLTRILRLNVRERRQWAQWLDCDDAALCQRDLSLRLYRRIAERRAAASSADDSAIALPDDSRDLDHYFSHDPARSPVAWFLRGVLPLYHCLREAEQIARQKADQTTLQLLAWFKDGRLMAQPAPESFGQPLRFQVLRTRERLPVQAPNLHTIAEERNRPVQQGLFQR